MILFQTKNKKYLQNTLTNIQILSGDEAGVICYLPTYSEENFSMQIHEMNFIAALLVIVIDAINDLALGIKDSATI